MSSLTPQEEAVFRLWMHDHHGWIIVCESPFEISNDQHQQSFATGAVAKEIVDNLRKKWRHWGRGRKRIVRKRKEHHAIAISILDTAAQKAQDHLELLIESTNEEAIANTQRTIRAIDKAIAVLKEAK